MANAAKARDDKFNERRAQLGEAALQTLAELGYARTSLREIAQNSAYSHGVLHYYFEDKVDLILCSVRQYKAICVKRYDQVTLASESYPELLQGFGDKLVETLREETAMHRLWYDLRTQAMFEPALRRDVQEIDQNLENMVWRVMTRFAELAGVPVRTSSASAYALLDGLFQNALQRHLLDDAKALPELKTQAMQLVELLVPLQAPA